MVKGWAVDAAALALAGGVELVLDALTYKIPYFLTRSDVAAAEHQESYTDSGFQGVISPSLLPPGSHMVALRIISADRKTFYQTATWSVIVQ
jgi:hypothetical protein